MLPTFTPGDHVQITAGHLAGRPATVREWADSPEARASYAPAISPDSHVAVTLDDEDVETWAWIPREHLVPVERHYGDGGDDYSFAEQRKAMDRAVAVTPSDVEEHPAGASHGVAEFECQVEGCDYVAGSIGLVAPGEVDKFARDVSEHQVSHPASDTPRDIGQWDTTAGDVIVFRRSDGVLRADVLADSSVKEPAHLRHLAKALNAAAVAWEAVL